MFRPGLSAMRCVGDGRWRDQSLQYLPLQWQNEALYADGNGRVRVNSRVLRSLEAYGRLLNEWS